MGQKQQGKTKLAVGGELRPELALTAQRLRWMPTHGPQEGKT